MFILKGRRGGCGALTFSPDGRTLAARYDGGLQLWCGLPEPEFRAIPTSPVGWMAFAPDGRTLYLDGGGVSHTYDLATDTFTELLNLEGGYRFAALSPCGRYIVAACLPEGRPHSEYAFRCWCPKRVGWAKPRWSAPFTRTSASRPLFLPDGRFVVLEWEGRNFCWVRRSKTGEPQAESAPFGWFPDWEAVSPDGAWVAGAKRNWATVWSVAELAAQPVELRNDSRKDFTDVAFTPSGRYLALSGNDGAVKLYDTATWQLALTYDWKVGKLTSVTFSTDGTAAAASAAGRVVVWDMDE